ncbi:hypothetical protein cce_5199 [Crocosphaera subtropica ATCC 51142]|uniref:Uncharacterized protein n=1 Tax=Crocosphaera subtropica (strain ATCC 51142 / BH68) TaxID=43989 RepID=B1X334_CROS5|nr:hypothetical protein [Crocosphaera subtropica]ACB54545.1 hypothetical protein cce_5199 [Crocosphaera subtropica ATCC 51142]
MTNTLEYIHQRPHLAKQIIGLNLTQLDQPISVAIAMDAEIALE